MAFETHSIFNERKDTFCDKVSEAKDRENIKLPTHARHDADRVAGSASLIIVTQYLDGTIL